MAKRRREMEGRRQTSRDKDTGRQTVRSRRRIEIRPIHSQPDRWKELR